MTVTVDREGAAGKEAHETLAVTSLRLPGSRSELRRGSSRIQPRVWSTSTMRRRLDRLDADRQHAREHPRYEKDIEWTGFDHPYLLVAFAPRPVGPLVSGVEKHTYADGTDGLMRTDMIFPPAIVQARVTRR